MAFRPAQELVHNQLMRIPAVRAKARSSHTTGIQSDPVKGLALFKAFAEMLPAPISSSKVLELGPGRGTALMRAACEQGVAGYAAFDIEPYLSPAEIPDPSIDYRTDPSGEFPWDPASFDVVWSHSVMEHVRSPRTLQAEVFHLLRPGGLQIADIDFVDHYQKRHDPTSMYNMLRYPERLWNLMTSNRSSYTNRLRYTDWQRLFDEVGFETVDRYPRLEPIPPEEFRRVSYLAHLGDDDLVTHSAVFVLRRPVG